MVETIGEIKDKYDLDFEVRDDMKINTYLKREGMPSLAKLIDD